MIWRNILTGPFRWVRIRWFRLLKRLCLAAERDPRLWVFGARDRLRCDENSKHLFEYVSREESDIQAVWLTRDPAIRDALRERGLDARMSHSLGGYLAQFRAGMAFINVSYRDISWFLQYGCPVVQLWHGTPMMENDLRYLHEDYAFVTVAAEEFLGEQRLGDPEVFDFRLTGYPRSDCLFLPGEASCVTALKRRYGTERLVLFVPTHRRPPQYDGQDKPVGDYGLFSDYGFDFDACERLMARHNALFLMKLHPLQPFGDRELEERFRRSRHMHIVDHGDPLVDVFDYMRSADVLVTDFSSIVFDFLLLDRPVVFMPFDIEEMRRIRTFRFDYDAITPGPKALDWPQTFAALDEALSGRDDFAAARHEVCRRFNAHRDGRSAARVAAVARAWLGLDAARESAGAEIETVRPEVSPKGGSECSGRRAGAGPGIGEGTSGAGTRRRGPAPGTDAAGMGGTEIGGVVRTARCVEE